MDHKVSTTLKCDKPLPQSVGKGHDGIADELQLVLEVGVVFVQLLFGRARSKVVLVVGRQ